MEEPFRVRMTFRDYLQMPEDRTRYEVLEGELQRTPAPDDVHQSAVLQLAYLLESWKRSTGSGGRIFVAPFDVVLSEYTVVQPDLLYLSRERLPLIVKGRLHGAPDLAVEVLSPGTAQRDRVGKYQSYARFGVSEYWIVDPEPRSVTMFILFEGAYVLGSSGTGKMGLTSPLFPGLCLRPAEIFEE